MANDLLIKYKVSDLARDLGIDAVRYALEDDMTGAQIRILK